MGGDMLGKGSFVSGDVHPDATCPGGWLLRGGGTPSPFRWATSSSSGCEVLG